MKKLIEGFFIVWMALGLAGCASVGSTEAARAHHVFIVSFDQGNPDLIQRSDMPTFHEMAAEGARTWSAYTVVPSLTLPSHTSMLTGLGVQEHQVLWNDYEPEKGVVHFPTIFSIAKEHGLVTAMYVGKEKFKHLDLPGSVDEFVWPQPEDDAKAVGRACAAGVKKLKPNLCFIHFRDPDTEGHAHGSHSPEKMKALQECDEALATIKQAAADAGILDDSVFILTADHGSHDFKDKDGITRGTHGDPESYDVEIPWVAWGKDVKKNYNVPPPVVQYDTAATALWLLGIPVPDSFWGRPIKRAFN